MLEHNGRNFTDVHLFIHIQRAHIRIEQKVIKVSIGSGQLYDFILIFGIYRIKLFIDRLHLFIGTLQLLIGCQQLFIGGLQLFIAGLRFLHRQLQVPVALIQRGLQRLDPAVLQFPQVQQVIHLLRLFLRLDLYQIIFPFCQIKIAHLNAQDFIGIIRQAGSPPFHDAVRYLPGIQQHTIDKGCQAGGEKGIKPSVKLSVLHPHILSAALDYLYNLTVLIQQHRWSRHGKQQLLGNA